MFQIKLPPNNGGSVVLDALTASDKPTLNTIAANNAIILFDLVAFQVAAGADPALGEGVCL